MGGSAASVDSSGASATDAALLDRVAPLPSQRSSPAARHASPDATRNAAPTPPADLYWLVAPAGRDLPDLRLLDEATEPDAAIASAFEELFSAQLAAR